MNKLIIYLITKKLGIKRNQTFRMKNQANQNDRYFFGNEMLIKLKRVNDSYIPKKSSISLNFLLSDECNDLMELCDLDE